LVKRHGEQINGCGHFNEGHSDVTKDKQLQCVCMRLNMFCAEGRSERGEADSGFDIVICSLGISSNALKTSTSPRGNDDTAVLSSQFAPGIQG